MPETQRFHHSEKCLCARKKLRIQALSFFSLRTEILDFGLSFGGWGGGEGGGGGVEIWLRKRNICLPRRHFSEKAVQVGFELVISSFKGGGNRDGR